MEEKARTMDRRLFKAAMSGDAAAMKQLVLDDPGVLLGTTPQGNNCLHIASIHGHEGFCKDALALNLSVFLLTTTNNDGETPLLTAVTRGRDTLASVLLWYCRYKQLGETILKQDKCRCNVLHHAIRRGYRTLALELIEAEPALSKAANKRDESPMFIAAMRNFEDVLDKFLGIHDSAHSGASGPNALHAAVRNGNKIIAKRVMEAHPGLARQENEDKYTPMHLAAYEDKIDMLTVLLEHDPSLGYVISTAGKPLLCTAAFKGHVGVARELLKHCPDAPYFDEKGSTCLHEAVLSGQYEFVEFVMGSKQLQHLINMADNSGKTALHLAQSNGLMSIAHFLGDKEKIINNDPVAETTASTNSSEGTPMDGRVLEAAVTGDARLMKDLVSNDPSLLLGSTPQGNTCLHIASTHGHEKFCKEVLTLNQSLPLLNAINADGETLLLTAVIRGHATLASVLLAFCRQQQLSETILKQDKHGFNALHHAILRGHRKLALELIEAEPALSKAVNKCYESPMFIAVMSGDGDVLEKLLEIPDSSDGRAYRCNALHAAVTSGNAVMAKRIMEARPALVREENNHKHTPMHQAANENKIDVVRVFLEHDPSLGYSISRNGGPLLCIAATKGNVGVARELLRHCPDPPYCDGMGSTCLHIAVSSKQEDFVRFIVRCPQLKHLVYMPNDKEETALQLSDRIAHPTSTMHEEPFTSLDLLLKAAASDNVEGMGSLSLDPGVLLQTTPQRNTCLHIAAIHGREVFCREAQALNPSLLAAVNSDGETPLLAAVASGHVTVASDLLKFCLDRQLSKAILKQDKRGCNALHHAIHGGHTKLALELIQGEPALSQAINKYDESPMFIAVTKNYKDVFDKLVDIPNSAHQGAYGCNALHAAVRSGNSSIVTKIMETRPALAREVNKDGYLPIKHAVIWDKIDVLRVLLEYDRSLGYVVCSGGIPLLSSAARRGHVGVAQELLKHCPDAPFMQTDGWTCLHLAVCCGKMEFVDFVLGLPQFGRIINMRDNNWDTALHMAVKMRNPKMVAALLRHPNIDVRALNNKGNSANKELKGDINTDTNHYKTLNWNEICMLMLKADPQAAADIYNVHEYAHEDVTKKTREDIESLTQKYTNNTSLVAILIATITFAAAFTLPGGYSTDAGTEGLPVMARKFAFKAFLISDTLAMCSSLAVAFICIIAQWEDLEFLLHYRYYTKKLMWFAYMATTTAFATGLYTVLAPRLLWLDVAVCVLTSLLPILTKFLGEWPILRLRFRLGRTFKSELLDMV